jgi:hypothetical protein
MTSCNVAKLEPVVEVGALNRYLPNGRALDIESPKS